MNTLWLMIVYDVIKQEFTHTMFKSKSIDTCSVLNDLTLFTITTMVQNIFLLLIRSKFKLHADAKI